MENINELAVALIEAQKQMGAAKKDSNNPFFKSKYADLNSVIDAVKEPLLNNGICFVQTLSSTDDRNYVVTTLIHKSGQSIGGNMLIKPTKDDMQGLGSAITYARRYGLQAICGLPAEDDDGNAASTPVKKQPDHRSIHKTMKQMVLDKAKLKFENKETLYFWADERSVNIDGAKDYELSALLMEMEKLPNLEKV